MARKFDPVMLGSAGLLGLLAMSVVWASVRPASRHVAASGAHAPAAWTAPQPSGGQAKPASPPATASTAASPSPHASGSPPPADERFVIKRILPIEGAIKYGEWHWDEKGVPAGPIAVTVDLDARVMSVFRGGYEIGAAAVLLGTQEKPTPTGVFPIKQKQRFHTSSLYDAPMPYMQRLTDDGITLHATKVEWGYASHGCVGMPMEFARRVFQTTHLGDKVYITRGKNAAIGDAIDGG